MESTMVKSLDEWLYSRFGDLFRWIFG